MSQSYRRIEWCLNKAKKELEECRRLNKRPKHKGLIKSEPNNEEAQNHLWRIRLIMLLFIRILQTENLGQRATKLPKFSVKKAEENLRFATSLESKNYGYKIIESIFYCMYQCFLSIAAKFGYESANQTCTISLIEYLREENKIELDKKFIEMMKYKEDQDEKTSLSIIDMREDYTYSAKISVEKDKIDSLILISQELIEMTNRRIYL
ncbi:MAG: hypothetical protein AABX12_00210 [Nanoarchaeota archaeon]